MRVYQFRSTLLLIGVEPGIHIVSIWTRQVVKSPRTSLGYFRWNRLLTNDVVVCVFKLEHKDLSGTSRAQDDVIKSDCAESSLPGRLFILWLDCGGTLATRRAAILQSSLNKLSVGVVANEVPGRTE